MNVRKNAPFEKLRPYNQQVIDHYPDPTEYTGFGGINNNSNDLRWNIEPTLPGVVWLRISERIPEFEFTADRGYGKNGMEVIPPDLWDIIDPLTATDLNPEGTRQVRVLNNTSSTRMLDIEIESSDPTWLKFSWRQGNRQSTGSVAKDIIPWLDNSILGDDAIGLDPMGNRTADDGELDVTVRCTPPASSTDERHGVYVEIGRAHV